MIAWTEELVYHDGARFFSDLCQAIDSARRSIEMESYIFDRDALGMRVLNHLAAAARRGVQVRLLLDGFGCSGWTYSDLNEVRSQGVDARMYHPLPWQNYPGRVWRYLTPQRLFRGLGKLNRRNHRKTCVIDGGLAFAGGMNVSARHLEWRDTSVRVRGEGSLELTRAFELAWKNIHGQRDLLRKERKRAYHRLLERILGAERRVWITNPYFVPDLLLIRGLRYVAWTGRDVRVLLPRRSDVWGIQWAIQAFYWILLSSKVRIFEYEPAILHAKILLIDDWASVGSTNLNQRSLVHDLEADIVLSQPGSVQSVEQRFLSDLARSREIEASHWERRPIRRRFFESLALVFRRWM